MKLFKCPCCNQLLHFENTRCESCDRRVGYLPEPDIMTALDAEPDRTWRSLADGGGRYRFCENAEHDTCNWLIPEDNPARFCLACRHNRTIPDLSTQDARMAWQKIEAAKHRLFYTLLRLQLPRPAAGERDEPLVFDFLADPPTANGPKVMTGHDNGVITIALAEADDAERERRRSGMGEPYRTLLGHFRHEVGHFYWDVLVRDGGHLDACRAVFGDDTEDYEQALKRHYAEGPPSDWQQNYISAYATTHAWEDFAETWAHYLHIIDTLEMAGALAIRVAPRADKSGALSADADEVEVYGEGGFAPLANIWVPLSFALNSVNRSMGLNDLYPFVLSSGVIGKLDFIHRLVHRQL